ncbi:MAG: NusG domain II-containing protein [Anaerosomatales bacterium]|nr:NusG domain II-containing protein [Anaerosomatales bacterium]
MTKADRLLAAALVCVALAASPVAGARGAEKARSSTVVVRGPSGTVRAPLDRNRTYRIQGLRGTVVVVVEDCSVRVAESSCRDRLCIRTGRVDGVGEAIACVPNGVIVTIVEGGRDDLDAVVR